MSEYPRGDRQRGDLDKGTFSKRKRGEGVPFSGGGGLAKPNGGVHAGLKRKQNREKTKLTESRFELRGRRGMRVEKGFRCRKRYPGELRGKGKRL